MLGGRAEVRAAYDAVADTYADHLATDACAGESSEEAAALGRFLDLVPSSQPVLDAGAGPGRMFEVLGARGHQVIGVDLSAGMVRRARRDHPDIPVAVADLTALPVADRSVGGYVSWFSTIHLDDRGLDTALREARRVLRDDGVAVVAFQSGQGVRDLAPVYRELGHEVSLSRVGRDPVSVVKVAVGHGLKVVAQHVVSSRSPGSDGRVVLLLEPDVPGARPSV